MLMDVPYTLDNVFIADERGYFSKCYVKENFSNLENCFDCSEVFFSASKRGVIRGMHFQTRNPQAKLVTVVKGAVFDVVVDLRKDSQTFGQYSFFELSNQNHKALYIPAGFAHGFQALEKENIMLYMCHGKYDKETDSGIRFDDSDIGIQWPLMDEVIVGSRDSELMSFENFKRTIGGL